MAINAVLVNQDEVKLPVTISSNVYHKFNDGTILDLKTILLQNAKPNLLLDLTDPYILFPVAFKEVAGLKSDGLAYFSSRYIPSKYVKYEVYFSYTNSGSAARLIGCSDSNLNYVMAVSIYPLGNDLYSNGSPGIGGTFALSWAERGDLFNLDLSNKELLLKGSAGISQWDLTANLEVTDLETGDVYKSAKSATEPEHSNAKKPVNAYAIWMDGGLTTPSKNITIRKIIIDDINGVHLEFTPCLLQSEIDANTSWDNEPHYAGEYGFIESTSKIFYGNEGKIGNFIEG